MKQLVIAAIFTLAIWNLCTFFLYGIDKRKAKEKRWRISENTLIMAAFLMGALGAILGMKVFHHKTNHLKFKILVPLALVFNIAIALGTVYFAWSG